MRGLTSLPRPLLRIAAMLLAAATVLYSALWMRYIRVQSQAMIGINYEASHVGHLLRVSGVVEGSGAAAAGVRPGDLLRAIDGQALTFHDPMPETVMRGRPGDVVRLTVERSGEAAPLVLPVVLGPRPQEQGGRTPARAVAVELVNSFPVVFLVVGFFVLFMRLQDRNAWLLALLFAGVIAVAPLLEIQALIPRSLRGFAVAYKVIFQGLFGAFSYYFCAVFPVPSPIDRRLPWLKSALLAGGGGPAVAPGGAAFLAGRFFPGFPLGGWFGDTGNLPPPFAFFFAAT